MSTREVNALIRMAREEREYDVKIAILRTAIADGDASGLAEGNVFERVRQKLGLQSA